MAGKKRSTDEEQRRLARMFPALKSRPHIAEAAWADPGLIDRSAPDPTPADDQPFADKLTVLKTRPTKEELERQAEAFRNQYIPTIYR